ncbi:hypothetical protein [Spongiactinospora gelatinilytica]|uniref:hypothetical protein n=1 Tax=Spongiactinospora gelatinilytica TaxID=2666298 RepID=UPI0013145E4E|nr:hypothetical protein [Spongiactinospora gelatinilytica]
MLGLLKNEGFTLTEGYYIAGYLLNGCMGLVAGDPSCRPNMASVRRPNSAGSTGPR